MRAAGLVVAVALLLAGCGFHLRGQQPLPAAWSAVAVRDILPKSPIGRGGGTWYATGRDDLHREVVQALDESGFAVSSDAPITVELLGSSVKRKTASVDATVSAAEYQINYEVRFRVVGNDGAEILPEHTVRTDSSYRFNENAVLGSAEQEEVLYADMRRQVARRIADQLRRRAANGVAIPARPAPEATASATPAPATPAPAVPAPAAPAPAASAPATPVPATPDHATAP